MVTANTGEVTSQSHTGRFQPCSSFAGFLIASVPLIDTPQRHLGIAWELKLAGCSLGGSGTVLPALQCWKLLGQVEQPFLDAQSSPSAPSSFSLVLSVEGWARPILPDLERPL